MSECDIHIDLLMFNIKNNLIIDNLVMIKKLATAGSIFGYLVVNRNCSAA